MKKILIYIFLSCSLFIVVGAFVTKSLGKEPMYFTSILSEIKECDIGYDIQKDISLLSQSMKSIRNVSEGGNDILQVVTNIGKTIYYFGRFVVAFVFDTLTATLNVMILVLRCIGLTSLDYIRTHSANDGLSSPRMVSICAY